MKKVFALSLILVLAVTTASFGAVKGGKVAAAAAAPAVSAPAVSSSGFTISPKFSYVGWMGLGVEFAPLYKITNDIDLTGELNYDLWGYNGGSGYVYGELNGVYNLQPIAQGDKTLSPYVGGGVIYGMPMGTANYGGSFSGGVGFGVFGGITTKFDPYIVYAQLKYASAPITWSYTYNYGFGNQTYSDSVNALGAGMEFGVRF